MTYLHWNEQTITDFSPENINKMFVDGYAFTRLGRGVMQQTRSVRIDLRKFALSSENRRILKKNEGFAMRYTHLPFPVNPYDFRIGKLAKDFYSTKFGNGIMSAQKIKEMLTDVTKSNFNTLISFTKDNATLGYAITYVDKISRLMHYSYPFYDLMKSPKDMGLGMMTAAIDQAKRDGLEYIYLGSLQNRSSLYKLQFEGLEWFDGKTWQTDVETIKRLLS